MTPSPDGRSGPCASQGRARFAPGFLQSVLAAKALTAVGLLAVGLSAAPVAKAANYTVALVSLDDDARYQSRRLERRYPGHPAGRLVQAAQLGASDAEVGLRAVGHSIKVIEATPVKSVVAVTDRVSRSPPPL